MKNAVYIYQIRAALTAGKIIDAQHRSDVEILLDALDDCHSDSDCHGDRDWYAQIDSAIARPFGRVRVCARCSCIVAGGPEICGRCVND